MMVCPNSYLAKYIPQMSIRLSIRLLNSPWNRFGFDLESSHRFANNPPVMSKKAFESISKSFLSPLKPTQGLAKPQGLPKASPNHRKLMFRLQFSPGDHQKQHPAPNTYKSTEN